MGGIPPVLPMAIAAFIVMAGWLVAVVLVLVFLNMRVRRLEREHPGEPGERNELAFLVYALSVFFWPAAFIVGGYFLMKPATARQGRVCVILGLVDISVIVVLTCIAMVLLALFAPEILP